ncbi:hypothetical protein [Streptomyces filipinensis]|uniref:hypothetical protein n=1 Tax=Streptomyces TaxID=1883 RepID=UPI0004CD266E
MSFSVRPGASGRGRRRPRPWRPHRNRRPLHEPTHCLSAALVEELDRALAGYQGVVAVIPDRRIRTRFTGRHLEPNAGRVPQIEAAAG